MLKIFKNSSSGERCGPWAYCLDYLCWNRQGFRLHSKKLRNWSNETENEGRIIQ